MEKSKEDIEYISIKGNDIDIYKVKNGFDIMCNGLYIGTVQEGYTREDVAKHLL